MTRAFGLGLALLLLLAACGKEQSAAPPPAPMTTEAMGRYCGMALADHPGPKGQVQVKSSKEVFWFSSARDTLAFTLLPEEPKDIAAIYVTAMDKAATWEKPGPESWIDARAATYVVGSDATGGMGQREMVPFSTPQAAEAFRIEHGGQVYAFDKIPHEQVLGEDTPAGQGHGASHQ
ncbi:MAG: nitrous oxide reductase accessory protein NosL [Magnetospirillum sp.]|nr:nitrous oxide reductase accessory protein NosL [Magnetospirillum sp.]